MKQTPNPASVLFVCTDNIGRSLIAEYALKDWLHKNHRDDINVSSCGTCANSDISKFCTDHLDMLKTLGIDTSNHKRTQTTKNLIDRFDIIIAMDRSHQTWLKDQFQIHAPLYNELCNGAKTDLTIADSNSTKTISVRLRNTVDYIIKTIPGLVDAIDKTLKRSPFAPCDFNHAKILVVGTSGSGKTTLARVLANRFGLTDIELDALFWEPNWTGAPPVLFRERIEKAMASQEGWIVHGNYGSVRDLTWCRAQIVIWLDYSLPVILWRVLKRSISRIAKNELLYGDNRETLGRLFFSKDSILLWALQTYRLRKRQYEELLQSPAAQGLQIFRFKKPRETEVFLYAGR